MCLWLWVTKLDDVGKSDNKIKYDKNKLYNNKLLSQILNQLLKHVDCQATSK